VAISYHTTPKLHKSVRASTSFQEACSGDIYDGVPTTLPYAVRESPISSVLSRESNAAFSFASPKSEILACPRAATMILGGLLSRWTIFLERSVSSASAS